MANLRAFPLLKGALWNKSADRITHWGLERPSGEEREDENERLSVATVQCCGLK